MLTEQNKELLHRYHVEVWEKKNLNIVDEFMAADFVSHSLPPGSPRGPQPVKEFLAMFYGAFPDLNSTEEDLFGENDKVLIRWTIRATHKGDFMGFAATGKQIIVPGMDILRIANGKFVEHWGGLRDQFGVMMQQLGLSPGK